MTLFSRPHIKRNALSKNFNYPLKCLSLHSPAHFKTHLQLILNFEHLSFSNVQQTSIHIRQNSSKDIHHVFYINFNIPMPYLTMHYTTAVKTTTYIDNLTLKLSLT